MTDIAELLLRAIVDNDPAESVSEALHIDEARRFVTAQLAALDAAGLQIVPNDASQAMINAIIAPHESIRDLWRAAVAAAKP